MNWPRRAEDMLYPGSLQNDHVFSSVTEVAASTRNFLDGPVWTVQPRKQPSTFMSYIQDTSRLSCLPRTWKCPRSLYWMLLASCTIGHCLVPKDRAVKWDKMNSAEYHRIPCIGSAAQRFVDLLQMRWLTAVWIILWIIYIESAMMFLRTRYVVIFSQLWPSKWLLLVHPVDLSGCFLCAI